jgi:ABC-2 type transport system ATP-binding protein
MHIEGQSLTPSQPAAAPTPAIVVEHLTKRYAGRAVVDDVSFQVSSGEILAVLGANGAGKSTTVEMLEGFRAPDRGFARVLGLDPWTQGDRLRPRIGLMLQEGGFYPAATPREIVRLYASFYDNPGDPESLIRLVGLKEVERARYRRLSGGEKQRLSLAVALVGRPELLFLDEPTAGMDPRARHATWEIIQDQRRRGVTILLTTHFVDEAEVMADRVAIIDAGRLIALGTPSDLIERTGSGSVWLTVSEPISLPDLRRLATVTSTRVDSRGMIEIESTSIPDLLVALAIWFRASGQVPRNIRVGGRSLEDAYLQMTGRPIAK